MIPNFLTIKARDIETWADSQIETRTHLPVFLRKLVHSTGNDLRRVDFPGYDNAQRPGNDGFVEAGTATPWIPEGNSYWEFGTNQRPADKANGDYKARLASVDPVERAMSTFIFVTPRNWVGKTAWEEDKNAARDWKTVRAFDASDLEQWLEQSVPVQIWLADQLSLPVTGYKTLDQAWKRWANASVPHLTPEIFAPSIAAYRHTFKGWLSKSSKRPFIVAADSRDEALAFLACLFDHPEFSEFKDLAAVFECPKTLGKLVASSVRFIPIVCSADAERELASAHRPLHCLVIRSRNSVDAKADVALDLLDRDSFEKALASMGIEADDVERLARESGRSPTILRRRLSRIPAISKPDWADDADTAKALAPMALIGAWYAEPDADRKIVSYLADRKYEAIEGDVARLLRFDDSPLWSAGGCQGVTSKIDVLFAIAWMVTLADLDRFFEVANVVLSETDPALELPEEDRWAAAVYGKKREHSGALHKGICETLVVLSIHGNNLFQNRLDIDVEGRVAVLIRELLTPLTLKKLLSHDRDLPNFAEAAPDEFLKIFEQDLLRDDPIVLGLLKPVDSGLFAAGPSRCGLLWALECLAWKPKNLLRVAQILAKPSMTTIEDNWANKPEASLQAIFRSWMPQTAASMKQRVQALKTLTKRFPDVGWKICIDQIKPGYRTGYYSYRPRWRSDASGAGQAVTCTEMYEFNRKALDLLVAYPSHDGTTLGDLVECLQGMPEEDQTKVWDLIDEWSRKGDEPAKAELRERIRRIAFTRRSRHRKLSEPTRDRARQVYDNLRPNDPVIRHGWLFANQWVQESADELKDKDLDAQKRHERIENLRRDALTEIWNGRTFEGVRELLVGSDAAGTVGRYAASCVTGVQPRVDFIRRCLSLDGDLRGKAELCLRYFLLETEDASQAGLLQTAFESLSSDERTRLFVCAPFKASTWRLLDDYGEDIRTAYWRGVSPMLNRHAPAEVNEIVDHLLEAQRPRAALWAVHMDLDDIETSRLKRLLRDVATVNSEPANHFTLDRYYISEALDSLDSRAGVTPADMAQLELLFIDALDHSEHGIPNLESQIAQSPALFVQAVMRAFSRGDEGEDPPEWTIQDPEQRAVVASAAHSLLNRIGKVPGTDESGMIDASALGAWLVEVRRLCQELARADVGDYCLGQLLSRAPEGGEGEWPCAAVCNAMEELASQKIGEGFGVGVLNSRGVYSDTGGKGEHKLAEKYRAWAKDFICDYPYVAGVLEDIAAYYDREATRNDAQARVRDRLRY